MWLTLAFLSAALLGCYDVCKKQALRENAVLPVLFLNTLFCSLLFLPAVLLSAWDILPQAHTLYVPAEGWHVQRFIVLKSLIVLSSWMCGYFGMKHLPLTLVGPINATRPVMVLLGALIFFGEHLNLYQWTGVLLAILSFFLMNRSGKMEGIDFRHNRWILCIVAAAVLGAISGLYDKFLMAPPSAGGAGLNRMTVQAYYNFYQCGMMGCMVALMWWPAAHREGSHATPFHWHRCIPLISLALSVADFLYFQALSIDGAMVSIVSMIRRGSVVVSFLIGAFVLHEKNIRSKAIDLLLVLLGMVFLFLGSK